MEKQRTKTNSPARKPAFMWETILFQETLSRKFFEQLPTGTTSLYLVVEFVDVVTHGHQEDLGKNPLAATVKKLPKTVILFNNPEGSFGLYGAVHPQKDTLLAGDAFQGLLEYVGKFCAN